jgi:hypothetical protein
MASTDYTTSRDTIASPLRRILKDRAPVILLFATAFAFHVAVLFNLLPA